MKKLMFIILLGCFLPYNGCMCVIDLAYPFPLKTEEGVVFIACDSDTHCYSNEICMKSFCFSKCNSNNDCLEQKTPCREMNGHKVCHFCFSESECVNGEICHKNVCRSKCADQNDCLKNYTCNEKLCLPENISEGKSEITSDGG